MEKFKNINMSHLLENINWLGKTTEEIFENYKIDNTAIEEIASNYQKIILNNFQKDNNLNEEMSLFERFVGLYMLISKLRIEYEELMDAENFYIFVEFIFDSINNDILRAIFKIDHSNELQVEYPHKIAFYIVNDEEDKMKDTEMNLVLSFHFIQILNRYENEDIDLKENSSLKLFDRFNNIQNKKKNKKNKANTSNIKKHKSKIWEWAW